MSRRLERVFIYIAAAWQLLDGLLTIFVYGVFIKKQGLDVAGLSVAQMRAMKALFGSIFNFVVIFGVLLILLGLLNIYLARKHWKDGVVGWKLPVWLLVCGIFSYFIMDIPNIFLFMSAGIIGLAKNKGMRARQNVTIGEELG
ncbi:hypothetical protein HCA63_01365 [Listeria booriae]|uniref:Uncharacterized protein n=1 Tax=Listeria booriae TaxID=1552123 RepID=A0A842FDV1_9LIST|nr:hypothetical protein [Listeria booriae]MBC1886989.1 hypothetical protein [Listeria booriae]MBC1917919.1 hypothetical protein [Listeria booriae]MBC2171518.1 hypothetical protein [Listeria booriae]MBC2179138.1 hypothetical protein [Listeria booriae]MBC2187706.1 hypothetical protein [Listeria booriae]